jgi:hypothetical protein
LSGFISVSTEVENANRENLMGVDLPDPAIVPQQKKTLLAVVFSSPFAISPVDAFMGVASIYARYNFVRDEPLPGKRGLS